MPGRQMSECNRNVTRSRRQPGLWLRCLAATGLAAAAIHVYAAGPSTNSSGQPIGNIGFEKNPPAALKNKFPMCDAFLKVQWISRKREIGYSEFETHVLDRHFKDAGRRKVATLVLMKWEPVPTLQYGVTRYTTKEELNSLFEALGNAEIGGRPDGPGLSIEYKGTSYWVDFRAGPDDAILGEKIVLSDYRQTVCVVYPDGARAWIAEGRRTENVYDTATLDANFKKVHDSGVVLGERYFKEKWVLDVNRDGIADYVGPALIYSVGTKYYSAEVIERPKPSPPKYPTNRVTTYSFPPKNGTCTLETSMYFLTTDGKDYFLNNRCNLTELTSQTGRE